MDAVTMTAEEALKVTKEWCQCKDDQELSHIGAVLSHHLHETACDRRNGERRCYYSHADATSKEDN